MQCNGITEIYGIMGKPVSHSLSPAMHNAAYEHLGLNKVYIPFPVEDVETALNGLRALSIKGVSVTIPHKQAVIPFLNHIDPVAKKIGAVNTLVIDGHNVHGYNTDWQGANSALKQLTTLKDKTVLLLGAGGSARAIGFGLLEEGANLTLASRTPARGMALADKLNCPWLPLTETESVKADILVNATSVGMEPKHDQSPLNGGSLNNFKVVMDIVYAPLKTKLLIEAEQAGCKIMGGLDMLLFQGVAQFELWTGHKAPIAIMREKLQQALTRCSNK